MQYIAQYVAVKFNRRNLEKPKMNDYQKSLKENYAFTPKAALDFAFLIEKQAESVYKKLGIHFPVITSSTVHHIGTAKEASLVEIARALEISHQLTSQRVKTLIDLDIIEANKDSQDKRRTVYSLTRSGKRQFTKLCDYLDKAEAVFVELNQELEVDFLELLKRAKLAFLERTIYQRIFSEE